MRSNLILLFTLLCFTLPLLSSAQSDQLKFTDADKQAQYARLKGTFQLQILNTRMMPSWPVDLLDQVETKRDADETIYIILEEKLRIMVLSERQIKRSDFVPLEKDIKYIFD